MGLSKELNKLVSIQACTPGKDAAGGNTLNYVEIAAPWAGIRNLPGNEKRASSHGGGESVDRVEVTIRFDQDVYDRSFTHSVRVEYKGRYYNVRHANNYNEKDERIILTCDTASSVAG